MSTTPVVRNSTDLSTKLVLVMYALTCPEGVRVREICLRHKRAGRVSGNWGRYYWGIQRVTFCVPQYWPAAGLTTVRPYSKRREHLVDRLEWLAATMAHELQHAKQDQILGVDMRLPGITRQIELQAEAAEILGLHAWRGLCARAPQVVAASRG